MVSLTNAPTLLEDRGSFRDRNNRVFDDSSHILRGISSAVLENWVSLSQQPFFQKLVRQGKVVPTELSDATDGLPKSWAAYMAHDRIPFISYPYEWSFGMLRDAALLHLEILQAAIPAGWTLKDATAYNVQFVGSQSVFIDIEVVPPGETVLRLG